MNIPWRFLKSSIEYYRGLSKKTRFVISTSNSHLNEIWAKFAFDFQSCDLQVPTSSISRVVGKMGSIVFKSYHTSQKLVIMSVWYTTVYKVHFRSTK